MKELLLRAATGAVYVALVLGCAYLGDVATAALFLPVCALGAHELWRLTHAPEDGVLGAFLTVAFASITYAALLAAHFLPAWSSSASLLVVVVLALLAVTHVLGSGTADPARSAGIHLLAIAVGASFGSLVSFFTVDTWLFVGFMLLLWTNDTGAYLVGRSLGRTKLLPSVSPKKTVEGLLGGIALTVLVSLALAHWHFFLSSAQWSIAAIVVAVSSTLGDLFESALKRARGVKDSGRILPGHGGILDRFDGFLLAAPLMLLVVRLMLA